MKILLVITKAEIGGAQVFVLNLVKGLKRRDYQVCVAGGEGEYLKEELNKIGINYHRFKNLKRGFNPIRNLQFIKELKNYIIKNNFDVVHLNSTNSLLGVFSLKKIKNINKIFTVHGLSLVDQNYKGMKFLKNMFKIFFKLSFKCIDKIVFVSRLNYNYAIDSNIVNPKKSVLIYNGVEIDEDKIYSKEKVKKLLSFSEDSFIYGSIGRLAYPKNYEFLIHNHRKVKEIIPKAKLLIIGEGPERSKYEGLIKTYGLESEVILYGELKDAHRYLKVFDLFVLPSIFEGLSISLIEAVMSNIPTIASKVGGNEEVTGSENCFKLNNREDYLRLFKEKVKNRDEVNVKEVGNNNIENNNKEKFRTDLMVDKYLEVYRA